MKIIYARRREGKTTELIKLSALTGNYILCASAKKASHIFKQSKDMNVNIKYPICVGELPLRRGMTIDSLLIDDIEEVLFRMLRVPIDYVTTSSEVLTIDEFKRRAE